METYIDEILVEKIRFTCLYINFIIRISMIFKAIYCMLRPVEVIFSFYSKRNEVLCLLCSIVVGRDNSVGMATR